MIWTIRKAKQDNRGVFSVQDHTRPTKRQAYALALQLREDPKTPITRYEHTYVVR